MKTLITSTLLAICLVVSAAEKEKESNLPKGNLIINGGAERDWYQTGILGPENQLIGGKYTLKVKGHKRMVIDAPKIWPTWSIDKTEKHSGNASFKVVMPDKTIDIEDLYFAPVPVGPPVKTSGNRKAIPVEMGTPVHYSVWIKAARKMKASMALFMTAGCAYVKHFRLTPEWKRYDLIIPKWGEKPPKGSALYADAKTNHGLRDGNVQPRVIIRHDGKANTIWIDDAKYWMGDVPEPPQTTDTLNLKGEITNSQYRYYRQGEPVELDFTIENVLDKERELAISYSSIGYHGETFRETKDGNIKLAPKDVFSKKYKIIPERNGPITISFIVKDLKNGKVYHHNYMFGVIGPESVMYPQIGVNISGSPVNIPDCVKLMKDFGVGSVRSWCEGMTPDDTYFGSIDLKKIKDAGIYVLYCFSRYLPYTYNLYVPNDLGPWLKYVEKTAKLNDGLVDAYEILNEPNIWAGRRKIEETDKFTQMSTANNLRTIKACAEVIKKVSPKTKIAGPTVSGTNIGWIGSILEKGGYKYLDIITEHPYRENPESPDYGEDLKSLKKLIGKYYKKPVPIFASESGQVVTSIPRDNVIDKEIRKSVSWNLRNQIIGYANGIAKYFHYNMHLYRTGTAWFVHWQGNPGNNYKVMPNAYLYGVYWMGHFIGDAKPICQVPLGTSLRCFIFEKNGKSVAVIWKWNELDLNTVLTLKNDKGLKPFDLFGNPTGKHSDRTLELTLNSSPTYLCADIPVSELKSRLKNADITGLGLPFQLSISFVSDKTFDLCVKNISHKPISGSCEILSESSVENPGPLNFKNLALGEIAKFRLSRTPGENDTLKVKTTSDDGKTSSVKDFKLSVIIAPKLSKAIKIDGDLSDWPKQKPLKIDSKNVAAFHYLQSVIDWVKKEDIKAEICTAWDPEAIYVSVIVEKPKSYFSDFVQKMYKSDGLQIAFDPLNDASSDCYGDDDYEYGVGIVNDATTVYRYNAASIMYDAVARDLGVNTEVIAAIHQSGTKTIYEMKFPESTLSPFKIKDNNSILFNLIVNLNNGKKRVGWLEIAPGIGQSPKCTKDFMTLLLSNPK